jgi:hypothetical protein
MSEKTMAGLRNLLGVGFCSQKFPKYYFLVSKIPEILFFALKNSRNIIFWSQKFPKYYILVSKIPEILFFGLKIPEILFLAQPLGL